MSVVSSLHTQASAWSMLFELLPHPAVLLRRGHLADANPSFQRMLQIDADELTGRTLNDMLPKQTSDKLSSAMQRTSASTLACTLTVNGAPSLHQARWMRLQPDSAHLFLLWFEPTATFMPTSLEKDLYDDLQRHRRLVESVMDTDERERQRLSDFLHDEVGSLLATAKHQLDMALNASFEQGKSEIEKSIRLVDTSIAQLRRVAARCAPMGLSFGLMRAVHALADELQKKNAASVRVIALPEDINLPRGVETAVYRIVQELLTNATHHAGASEIVLQLIKHATHVTVSVEDNGNGFDMQHATQKTSALGLKKVEQRVQLFNGSMAVDSSPARGTVVTVELPTDYR